MNLLKPFIAIFDLGAPELIMLFGIAIIVVVFVAVGRLSNAISRRGNSNGASTPNHAQKKCPDCADFVRVEARVCKHCGYRFDVERPKT